MSVEILPLQGNGERIPGGLFRAMAKLYLRKFPSATLGGLIRELQGRLSREGIDYHKRTLRRQLAGAIQSVPESTERAMKGVLVASNGPGSSEDIEKQLEREGLLGPLSERVPVRVHRDRVLSLARLWLHLNPGASRRSLAERLHRDLSARDVPLGVNFIQSILAGQVNTVRTEVRGKILDYLEECGVRSEKEALERCRREKEAILDSLKSREFAGLPRFLDLCRLWKLRRGEPSSRRLACRLRDEMSRRGVSRSLHHFQELLEGRLCRVRRAVLETLEEIVRDGLGLRDLDAELRKLDSRPDPRDLEWVRAEPVAGMAREWVSKNPGTSFRRLAFRVAEEVRRAGFPGGVSTIQPVLGGWKKKTRGFIYRAVARQVGRRADIPDELLVRSPRRCVSSDPLDPNTLARRILSRAETESKPGIETYVRQARRFLGKPRCSPHLREFLLLRMEKAYRVSRRRASNLLAPDHA